jgi:hypothetical protein
MLNLTNFYQMSQLGVWCSCFMFRRSWAQISPLRPAFLMDAFCGSPQFFQANAGTVLHIKPCLLLSTSFPNSLFTNSTIQHYLVWATHGVSKLLINKNTFCYSVSIFRCYILFWFHSLSPLIHFLIIHINLISTLHSVPISLTYELK